MMSAIESEMGKVPRPTSHVKRLIGTMIPVFVLFLALYWVTAQRGASWQDSGIFQHRVLTGTFTDLGGGGLAVVHPWYLKTARLFSLCFPTAWRLTAINGYSGVGAAAALALCALLLSRLTRCVTATVAGVATLGLAHMVWWLATIAEVYTWSLAFLFAELLCLLNVCRARSAAGWQWAWYLLLLLNGLHASLHNVAFLNLPVYGVLWVMSSSAFQPKGWQRVRFGVVCACCWLTGASLLVMLVLRDLGSGHPIMATFKSLLVGTGYGATVVGTGGVDMRLALANLALAGVSFATPCWVLALRAVNAAGDDMRFKRALRGMTAIHTLFWVRYFVPDQATFLLPTLGLGAVWLGLGAARCKAQRVLAMLAIGVTMQVAGPPLLARAAQEHIARARTLPFRDEARYWLVPWKHNEHSAQQFAEAVDRQLRDEDLLLGDLTAVNPIVVAAAVGVIGSAWRLVSGWSGESDDEAAALAEAALVAGRRVYVVSPVPGYIPAALLKRYAFEPEGVLWRMKEKE